MSYFDEPLEREEEKDLGRSITRIGQQHVLPTRVRKRLLGSGAVVIHTLNDTLVHSGEVSNAQHGARTVASAHRLVDISPRPHSDITGVGANDHHNQSHVLATGTALGADHTMSGAAVGEVLRALSATTAAFDQLNFSDLAGTISATQATANFRRHMAVFIKDTADAAAADATAEIPIFQAVSAVTITGAFFLPAAALTAADTNFATLFCRRRNSTGGGVVTVASVTTEVANGNWTAFDGVSLGTLSNTAVAAGEMILFEITKTGTGIVIPRGVLQIEYTID